MKPHKPDRSELNPSPCRARWRRVGRWWATGANVWLLALAAAVVGLGAITGHAQEVNRDLLNFRHGGEQWRVEGSDISFGHGVVTAKNGGQLLTRKGVLSKDAVAKYDRLVIDYRIAGGPPNGADVVAKGLPQNELKAPKWNVLGITSPTGRWITRSYDLHLPKSIWGKETVKKIAGETGLALGFTPGPATTSLKMRDIRFIADPFRIKYDWKKPFQPVELTRHDDGTLSYTKTFTLISNSDKPVSIDAAVGSKGAGFHPKLSPARVELKPGEKKQVTFTARSTRSMSPLHHQRMSVAFTPDGNAELVQRRGFMIAAPTADQKTKPIFGVDHKPHDLKKAMALPVHLPPGPVKWMSQSKMNKFRAMELVGYDKFKDKNGKIYSGTRYTSGAMHRLIIKAIGRLADGYADTGDKKYAKRVRDWFLAYAKHGSDYPLRKPIYAESSYLSNNVSYVQSAVVMNPLMRALNKVWYSGVFSDEQKKTIHDRFILPRAVENMKTSAGVSNQQDEVNLYLFVAGVTTNDPDLISTAVYGQHGVMAKLSLFTPDGSTEESIASNYHGIIVKKVEKAVKAIQAAGLDLDMDLTRLNKAKHLEEKLVMPNGEVPNRGDSPTPSRAMSPEKAKELPSMTFDYFGMSILRGGKDKGKGKDTIYVALDHRPPATSHSHHDKLSIVLYGAGHIFGVDEGSLYNIGAGKSKNVPDWHRRQAWGHVSLVHNTVTVDQKDQLSGGGHRLYFQGDDAPVKAVGAYTDNSFDGDIRFERHIAMQGGVIVMVDRLSSDKLHTYDLTHHSFGDIKTDVKMHAIDQLGDHGQYKLPEDVRKGEVGGHHWAQVSWRQDDARMHYQVLNTGASSMPLFTATGWANVKYHLVRQPAPFLLARQHSKNAVFVSVINFGDKPAKITRENLTPDRFSIDAGGESFVFDFKDNKVTTGK